jgi:hypothetical protein
MCLTETKQLLRFSVIPYVIRSIINEKYKNIGEETKMSSSLNNIGLCNECHFKSFQIYLNAWKTDFELLHCFLIENRRQREDDDKNNENIICNKENKIDIFIALGIFIAKYFGNVDIDLKLENDCREIIENNGYIYDDLKNKNKSEIIEIQKNEKKILDKKKKDVHRNYMKLSAIKKENRKKQMIVKNKCENMIEHLIHNDQIQSFIDYWRNLFLIKIKHPDIKYELI